MMPTGPKAAPVRGADISMWNNADGRWLALLKYGSLRMPVIRDTHYEAHAAAVKFWREHTAAGRAAAG